MEIRTEQELINYGKKLADNLTLPAVFELTGDVGVGKTTLTRGLAEGLGVKEPVTSPSFTISKRYGFEKNGEVGTLVHYDFYRLPDPGLMLGDLEEAMYDPDSIVVVEWADSVANILPEDRIKVEIKYISAEEREINLL